MITQYSLSPLQAGSVSVSRGKTLILFMPETPMVSNVNLLEMEQINVISDNVTSAHLGVSFYTHTRVLDHVFRGISVECVTVYSL